MPLDSEAVAAAVVMAMKAAIAPLQAELATMRAHVDALAARAPEPGPAGPAGEPGAPGVPGPPGADGLGFDDLSVDFDGHRTITIKFLKAFDGFPAEGREKSFAIELPILHYRGPYTTGTEYRPGDVVMHGGSAWHCAAATTHPPMEAREEWALMVRRGRDGRDKNGAR